MSRSPPHVHGKEGVDGSSPSEGLQKRPANGHMVLPAMARLRVFAGTRRVTFWDWWALAGTRDVSRHRVRRARQTRSRPPTRKVPAKAGSVLPALTRKRAPPSRERWSMAHPTSPVRPRSSGCSQNHPRTARLRKVVRGRNDGLNGLDCVVGECEQRAHLLLVGSGRSSAGLQWLCAARDFAAECRAGVEYASMDAAELLAHVRAELAPVARTLAEHRYLVELESGRVPLESLRSFAGEQRAIIASDKESFEHLAHRFPAPPAAGFFRELAAGEAEALRLLGRFAAAVGLGREYEPLAGCQAYSAYVAWLALKGSPAAGAPRPPRAPSALGGRPGPLLRVLASAAGRVRGARACARHGRRAVERSPCGPPASGLRAPLLGYPRPWPSLTPCEKPPTRSGPRSTSTRSCAASAREASTHASFATTSVRTICS